MEKGESYSYRATITEPGALGSNPPEREASYCPASMRGKFNGIMSGVSFSVDGKMDSVSKFSYAKRNVVSSTVFTIQFNP